MPIAPAKSLWKKIVEQYELHKAIRLPTEAIKKEVIELLRPELPLWDNDEPYNAGLKRNISVYNSAPQEGLETWADGMQGHLATAAMPWFLYRSPNLGRSRDLNYVPIVRNWLEHAQNTMTDVLQDSNYYSYLSPIFRDAGSVGSAAGWIELNEDKSGIDCLNFHPREIFVSEDHAGNIDQFIRGSYQLTALSASRYFDKEKLSDRLNKDLTENSMTRHKFISFTAKKTDPIFDGEKDLPSRPWISVDIQEQADLAKQKPLKIEGYWSKPFSYWRFQRTTGSSYGWGLGCSAIVDIYGLHQITKNNLRQGEFATDPALYVPGSKRARVQMRPGGQTFGKVEDIPRILYDGGKYQYSADREDRAVLAIERWFNVPFFEQLNRAERQMTAYEVAQRLNEKGIILGPKTGRLNREQFDQNHQRVFEICLRQGWIEPPPDILMEQTQGHFTIDYNGILEQAQRIAREILQTQGVFEQVGFFKQLKEDVTDNFDIDKTVIRIARNRSLPEGEIRTKEDVAAIRQSRADAMAKQAQLEMAKEMAGQVPNLSKAPEEGSPIQQLIGAGT